MSVFEELFESTVLEVVVPDTSVDFPAQNEADDWLRRVQSEVVERKQAFFDHADEQLQSMLLIRISPPEAGSSELADSANPPPILLEFLSHLQISLEATYISPHAPPPSIRPMSNLVTPPRTDSAGRLKPQGRPNNPSIFPPPTPNPMPSTAEPDRKYVQSEGTLLISTIWGQKGTSEDGSGERLTLLWSEKEKVWVAVYQLSLTVAFLRLNTAEPLLCLTVSATLREKRIPIASKREKHPLLQFLNSHGDVTQSTPSSPLPPASPTGTTRPEDALMGLEEINLLSGLAAGPNFHPSRPGDDDDDSVHVPSTRLGDSVRRTAFALPSASIRAQKAQTQTQTPTTAHSTLRKSFRKTLRTVSGFRVRMRTVFVPYVLLNNKEEQDEDERREAGNEERTVVLCVEVENSGESGPGVGFAVEKVEVNVGDEGATATLIGWDDEGCQGVFPVRVGSMEQYNLLYAVSFLQNPDDMDNIVKPGEIGRTKAGSDLQRAVAINIFGRPYTEPEVEHHAEDDDDGYDEGEEGDDTIGKLSTNPIKLPTTRYPTHTFSSRWNCTLDLSPQAHRDPGPSTAIHAHHQHLKNVLPEPASPFPMSQSQRSPLPAAGGTSQLAQSQDLRIAGSKRYTVPVAVAASRGAAGSRMSFPRDYPSSRPGTQTPPSISIQPHGSPGITSSPTTFVNESRPSVDGLPPVTPAYPAYPRMSISPIPQSHSPISGWQGSTLGPSVEIRRDRASMIYTGGTAVRDIAKNEEGEPIVVSVGLLSSDDEEDTGHSKIHPLDTFTLDIFIFNQSSWTRRFEVSYPDQRTRRKQDAVTGQYQHKQNAQTPGILPLDNRVRIGPLLPSTCQSVRLRFLAITPGVHSIDTLTLTDIVSGYSMNLRSVMDIVVHEPLHVLQEGTGASP
ncbi:hypothetical protein HWV62_38801 [Athelia sp. TMB]|nr:hypothetical protein HWV62_38801 [Athelia sp. TMB]